MAIAKTTVTGPILDATGSAYVGAYIRFTPSAVGRDDADDTVISQGPVEVATDPSTGAFSIDLAPSDSISYSVSFVGAETPLGGASKSAVYKIGTIYVPSSGPVALEDLLPIYSPDLPTNAELLAALSAAVASAEASSSAASGFVDDASDEADRAAAAAVNAALGTPYGFETVPLLIDDDVMSYTAGPGLEVVTAGQYIRAGGFRCQVAASDATDHHLVTAGGVKLDYVSSELTMPNRRSFITNPDENYADPAAEQNIIIAGGSPTQPCFIGLDGAWPVKGQNDAGLTAFLGWGADDYVSGAGLSSIVGGYDNIVNAGASSIFGSYHCMIAYGTDAHNMIVNSADSFISGDEFGDAGCGRAGIFSARRAAIRGGLHGLILGGDYVRLTSNSGSHCTIINSNNSDIDSGRENFIFAGEGHLITGDAGGAGSNRSGILAGKGSTIGSNANDALVLAGDGNEIDHSTAVGLGVDVKTVGGGLHHGVDRMVQIGDAQTCKFVGRTRTADASNESFRWAKFNSGTQVDITLPAVSAGTGRIKVIGLMDGSADANNDGVYTQVSYITDFGFSWDGSNAFLFKSGTEEGPGASEELSLDLISQTGSAFTPANTPRLRLSGGILTARTNGVAAKDINWVCDIEFVMTRVS